MKVEVNEIMQHLIKEKLKIGDVALKIRIQPVSYILRNWSFDLHFDPSYQVKNSFACSFNANRGF